MPVFVSGRVEVSVPATSANLGPGFDSLGVALGIRDRVTAQVIERGIEITVSGVGEGEVPLDEQHLVHQAMQRAFHEMKCAVPGIRLHCDNSIPHSRGLGSSSAAIVAGICSARALVAGGSLLLGDDAVFRLAATMEGHPDNVAPAFYGGCTVACSDGYEFWVTGVPVDPRITAVVFVPPEAVETRVARGMLPPTVTHGDAVANAGRAALLVAALGGRPELLLPATEDRLHQEYREPAMPATLRLVHALRADRIPAVISGAGPSVLAFADVSTQAEIARRVPHGWQVHALSVDPSGAVLAAAR